MNPYRLHDAVEVGDLQEVRKILKEDGVVVDRQRGNPGFLTPFAIACFQKDISIMRALLEAGANPRQGFQWYDGHRTNAALAACRLANVKMLKLMFEFGISASDVFHEGVLLAEAARTKKRDSKQLMKLLLDGGAEVDARRHSLDQTALHAASESGNLDAARLLLKAGASVNVQDRGGRTPLFLICDFNSKDANYNSKDVDDADRLGLIELLISHGADVHMKTTVYYSTPLRAAASRGYADSTRLLLKRGAKLDTSGYDVLKACERGHHDVVEALLEAGADVNVRCRESGRTSLFKAIEFFRNNFEEEEESGRISEEEKVLSRIFDLLLAFGADINLADEVGSTPLHYAVSGYEALVVRLLLQRGADAETTRDDGVTPFLLAVMRGRKNMLKEFLEHQSDRLPTYEGHPVLE